MGAFLVWGIGKTSCDVLARADGAIDDADRERIAEYDPHWSSIREREGEAWETLVECDEAALLKEATDDDAVRGWCRAAEPVRIVVADVGAWSEALLSLDGTIQVIQSGGCPVHDLLRDAKIDPRESIEAIAAAVLARWSAGYEGDPAEARLFVRVERDGECVEVRP